MSETRCDKKTHFNRVKNGTNFLELALNSQCFGNTERGNVIDMAADILRFSTEKDPFVNHSGMNIASDLLEALGELAVAQERGGSREHLASLGRSVDAAVRRMNEFSDIDSAA